MGAVLGKEFDLPLAAELVGQESSQAIAALEKARERHYVWVRPDGIRCAFVHDKIRAALLERLSPQRRQELHYRIALSLQANAPDRIFDLAYHFDAAGRSEQALPYALQAACQARSQHSLGSRRTAVPHRRPRRPLGRSGHAVRHRRGTGRRPHAAGTIRRGRGTVPPRRPCWATANSPGPRSRARSANWPSSAATWKAPRWPSRTRSACLEKTVPRHTPLFLLLLVWEVAVQALHTLFPAVFVHRRKRQPSPAELLGFRMFSRLAHGYWFVRGRIQSLWAHLRGMNLVERYPPTMELAQAYSEHAPGMSLIGYYSRGIVYAEKSLALRRSFSDAWGQGQSLNFYGILLYAASRFTTCVEKSREAVRLLQRTGDYWEMNMARYQMAAALFRLGEHREALRRGPPHAPVRAGVGRRADGGHQPRSVGLCHRRPNAGRRRQACLGVRAQRRPRHDPGPAGRRRAIDGPGPARSRRRAASRRPWPSPAARE